MHRDTPRPRILVVGAGPTGLTLALCLRAYGIDCDVWDAKAGPVDSSKALAINPLSLQQLDLLGLPLQVGERARRVRRLSVTWQGRTRLNPIDLRHLDCPRNAFLIQPQYDTECDLLAGLLAAGGRVSWGTSATRLTRCASGTQVEGVCAERGAVGGMYDFVIGCDGKRSVVREHIGAELDGTEYGMYLALGDYELDWDADPGQVHYFVHDETFFVFVPLPGKRWRVVAKCDGAPGAAASDDLIREAVRRHFGRDILAGAPSWSSLAPLYVQVASKLRLGNVFIAGDAAHLYSPIGGTGMNTGMQDALNLGWKLAYTVLGWADEGLLASYERERLPVIKANAASTDQVTRLIARLPVAEGSHLPFMPRMAARPLLRRQFPAAYAGLAMRYESGHVNTGCVALLPVLRQQGLVGVPMVRVVAFGHGAQGRADYADLRRHCEGKPGVQCVLLDQGEHGAAWRALGGRPDTVQVIRPDAIVVYDGALADWRDAVARLPSNQSLFVKGGNNV